VIDEQHACAGVAQDRHDLFDRVVRIEWNGNRAKPQDAEICAAPPRVVVGENGAPIACADALRLEPRRAREGEIPQLPVCVPLERVAFLDFHGRALFESRRGRVEDVPEIHCCILVSVTLKPDVDSAVDRS
jgi:hypothetical protein